ncbi:hypothetical protein KQH82_00765 [bacterium]|nr:hypothetical protein [bacterium]
MEKRPRIQTNEGPPDKTVRIIATIVDRPDSTYPVIIKPYKLDLSQFGDDVRDQVKFTISNVSEEDLAVTLQSSKKDYFTVDLPKVVKAGQTAEGTLTLTDMGTKISFAKSFTFQLSDMTGSRFTVPVKRTMRTPGVQATPAKGYGDQGKH